MIFRDGSDASMEVGDKLVPSMMPGNFPGETDSPSTDPVFAINGILFPKNRTFSS